jgi:hypothetical protein
MVQRSALLSGRLSRFFALLRTSKQNIDKVCKQQQKMVKETVAQDLTPFLFSLFMAYVSWLLLPFQDCKICKSAHVTIILQKYQNEVSDSANLYEAFKFFQIQ